MQRYHKIQSIFYRDPETKYKRFIEGKWTDSTFEYLRHSMWEFTEKVDGTNIRIGWNGGGVIFGGRGDNSKLPGRLRISLQEHFTEELMSDTFQGDEFITLIGEGYGDGIQKGKYYSDDQKFILFDVFVEPNENNPLGIWLERKSVEDVAKTLSIDVVPIILTCSLIDAIEIVKNKALSLLSQIAQETKTLMEGFVGRPITEMRNRFGSRIITKIKVKDFPDV